MNEQQKHKNHYTLTDIEQYLRGNLSPAEMHELEKAALQDPFLADAIEGYRSTNLETAKEDLAGIHHQLSSGPAKIIPVNIKRNHWWRVAAVFILLAGAAGLSWFLVNRGSDKRELAQQHMPASLIKADTTRILPATPVKIKKESHTNIPRQGLAVNNQKQKQSLQEDLGSETVTTYNKAAEKSSTVSRDYYPGLLAKHPKDTIIAENLKETIAANRILEGRAAGLQIQGSKTSGLQTFGGNAASIDRKVVNAESKNNPGKLNARPDTSAQFLTFNGGVVQKIKFDTLQLADQAFRSTAQPIFNKPVNVSANAVPANITVTGFTVGAGTSSPLSVVPSTRLLKQNDSANSLSEVIVTGYGTRRKKDLTAAYNPINSEKTMQAPVAEKLDTISPVGGWKEFTNYMVNQLNQSTNTPKSPGQYGWLEMKLSIDKTGKVTKVKFVRSFDKALNKILLKAITEGPHWITVGQAEKMDYSITIKL